MSPSASNNNQTDKAETKAAAPQPQRSFVGADVLFRFLTPREGVVIRPAKIVKVWERPDVAMPLVNLVVFIDGVNDTNGDRSGEVPLKWATSCHFSEAENAPWSTWFWPTAPAAAKPVT